MLITRSPSKSRRQSQERIIGRNCKIDRGADALIVKDRNCIFSLPVSNLHPVSLRDYLFIFRRPLAPIVDPMHLAKYVRYSMQ